MPPQRAFCSVVVVRQLVKNVYMYLDRKGSVKCDRTEYDMEVDNAMM